jgi:hypothetical protein
MAVAADVRTFWSALLSVLLKCIAALGFGTRARTTAAALPQTAPAGIVPATAAGVEEVSARGRDVSRAKRPRRAKAAPADRAGRRPGAGSGVCRVPAPRSYEPQRHDRKRTLPPTMKQRIGAEAHGSSPSSRSLRIDDVLGEDFDGAMAVPETAENAARTPAAASAAPAASPASAASAVPASDAG